MLLLSCVFGRGLLEEELRDIDEGIRTNKERLYPQSRVMLFSAQPISKASSLSGKHFSGSVRKRCWVGLDIDFVNETRIKKHYVVRWWHRGGSGRILNDAEYARALYGGTIFSISKGKVFRNMCWYRWDRGHFGIWLSTMQAPKTAADYYRM